MAYLDETGLARLWSKVKDYVDSHSGGGGTSDYTALSNKPSINGVTLTGNKTGSDLGLVLSTVSQTLTVSSEFVLNDTSIPITLKKFGDVVSVTGIVSPKSAIAGAITRHTICTIPTGYRPTVDVHVVAQGSGNAQWLLSITTAGAVQFSRYHNTASAANTYNSASTEQWLPFHATWII